MNELVIEQGTLLDRIEENIDQTLSLTVEGNDYLRLADKHQENSCARRVTLCLLGLIVVFSFLLALKHL
jgi:hypothetical protein